MKVLAVLALWAAATLASAEERTLDLGNGKIVAYSIVEPSGDSRPSARPSAMHLIGLLAAGRIEEASALSNAPQRRLEVLRDYRAMVGEEEFKRVFAQFLNPANRIAAEVAIERHRLLIWDLGEANHHLAAQYYVEVEGRFLMDDVPSETRANLRRVLQRYRTPKSSGRTD